jgi:hypothetical protein
MARPQTFSIRRTNDGACCVQKNSGANMSRFPNIQEALHFIREQRRGRGDAKLAFYDSDGELLFTEECRSERDGLKF